MAAGPLARAVPEVFSRQLERSPEPARRPEPLMAASENTIHSKDAEADDEAFAQRA